MEEQKAWSISDSHFLAIQTSNEGYDYTLYDRNYKEVDGGQLDMPQIKIDEARDIILKEFGLEARELNQIDYDDLVDITQSVEIKNWSVNITSKSNIEENKIDIMHSKSSDFSLTTFFENEKDSFAIFQLKNIKDTSSMLFLPYKMMEKINKGPHVGNYDVVYVGGVESNDSKNEILEGIFEIFNLDHPSDFKGHSLSVGDVVALKMNGEISCHYVDTFGFKELPNFLQNVNHLRSVEDIVEQNDNCFDGIINNVSLEDKKPSVLDKINNDKCIFKSGTKRNEKERD